MWDKDGKCSVCGEQLKISDPLAFTKHLGANPKCRGGNQTVHATESGTFTSDIRSARDVYMEP
jgi:hypothetical protein